MAYEPRLIIEVPSGGLLDHRLREARLESVAAGRAVVETGPTDAEGNLESAAAGEVVLSVLSPEALRREAEEVRRVTRHAGTGVEPLVVVVEAAEELRDEELAPLLEAASHTTRPVILRVVRDA